MVKTVFAAGQRVSPQFLNAVNSPQFVVDEGGEEYDGQHIRLRDVSLSNDSTQMKTRYTTFEGELAVTAGAGLSVTYRGGRQSLASGLIITIAPGTLTGLANNAVSIVSINELGVIVHGAVAGSIRCLLARVTTSGGVVTQVEDLRQRFGVSPAPNLIKALGGTGGSGDYNLASGSATLGDGLYYFRNLTVANGATLTISGFARIFCSGNVLINGAVNVSNALTGGSPATIGNSISVFPVIGAGIGSGVFTSSPYNPALSPIGSSGGSSGVSQETASNTVIRTGAGGEAGGGLWIEAGGTITLGSTGAIAANGGNGGLATISSGTGPFSISGSSGGSGGTIQLYAGQSILLSAGSSISCNAGTSTVGLRGNGSVGLPCGGCGSAGGQVILLAPAVSALGTISVLGAPAAANAVGGTCGYGSACGASNGGQGGATSITPAPGASGRIVTGLFLPVGA